MPSPEVSDLFFSMAAKRSGNLSSCERGKTYESSLPKSRFSLAPGTSDSIRFLMVDRSAWGSKTIVM